MDTTLSPVPIRTMEIKNQRMTIYYPHIGTISNPRVQQKMNEAIFKRVESLIRLQHERQDSHTFAEMIGFFEIKTNERNILSLTLSNYAISSHAANGLTVMDSLTFDVATGKEYSLEELFIPGSAYNRKLTSIIKKQMDERDIPVLTDFNHIAPDQNYYIADKALVIYFQSIEITPHYVGLPMFPISVYQLEDIIAPDGPLGRMLSA